MADHYIIVQREPKRFGNRWRVSRATPRDDPGRLRRLLGATTEWTDLGTFPTREMAIDHALEQAEPFEKVVADRDSGQETIKDADVGANDD